MNSLSTSENEIDILQDNSEDLVAIQRNRIHKMYEKKDIQLNHKKKTFIDLTEVQISHKPKKISNQAKKKSDPFQKLGKEVNDKVAKLMLNYKSNYKRIITNNSVEEFNENMIEFFTKYLLYGVEQQKINKPQSLEQDQKCMFQGVIKISQSIQKACFKTHSKSLKAYQSRCKMILDNVKDVTNWQLRSKIIQGLITPQQLSLVPQSQLDSSERKLSQQQKLKYLLAQANITPMNQTDFIENESLIPQIQLKPQVQVKKPSIFNNIQVERFAELQRLILKIPQLFRQKIKRDLPEQLNIDFQAQLSIILL